MATWVFQWFPPGVDPDRGEPFFLSFLPNRLIKYGSILGAYSPPFTPVNQDIPFQPGSLLKFIKVGEAEIDLRMILIGTNSEDFWTQMAQYRPLFNPLMGQGWLQITNPSGDIRRLQCSCISGFNMDASTYREYTAEIPLTFYANYPYWLQGSLANNENVFPYNNGENRLTPPILPMFINRPGDTIFDYNIINMGDVNAALTVIINGPCQSPIITNLSVGNSAQITQRGVLNMSANGGISLAVGTPVTINFYNKTIVKGIKRPRNQIGTLTTNSTFWPLLPGVNRIRLQILGATNQTKVQYIWRNTYSTMY